MIKWKSSNSKIASVDKNGIVTAKKAGSVKITAYLADFLGKMCLGSEAVCTVKVEKPSIKVSPAKAEILKGGKKQLKASVKGTDKKVIWSSSNKGIASVSAKGVVTAKKPGSVTITAKVCGVSAKCRIVVLPPSLKLSPEKVTLTKGKTRQLIAKVQGLSKKITWKSSKSSVAAVSSKGKITAKKYGETVISATANGITKKCTVKVKPSIKLKQTSATLQKSKTMQLHATVDGPSKKVTWSSSNKAIASVNSRGQVTGKKRGIVTIRAKANGVTAVCRVSVQENDGLEYRLISNGTAYCVYRYRGNGTSLTIPSRYNGLPVTEIGWSAINSKTLKKITLPNSIRRIEGLAFYNCRNLTSINIPYGVTFIGEGAFAYCEKLKNVKLPDTVRILEKDVFEACFSLENFYIPKGITVIPEGMYKDCVRLKNFTIPNHVLKIGKRAFYGCDSLTSMIVPGTVAEIGGGAFLGCKALKEIRIQPGVMRIGGGAFESCQVLTTITIPSSVKQIESFAFAYSNQLSRVNYQGTREEWLKITESFRGVFARGTKTYSVYAADETFTGRHSY